MATNQVLNVVDEVIDGTPKYTITDNADGTKNISLANSVTTQGTSINKALLNKVDNVLSYLKPSVTKVGTQNQFTLDNNTSFVNNQRVLIETPHIKEFAVNVGNEQVFDSSTINRIFTLALNNNNFMVFFQDESASTKYVYFMIYDEDGNVVKAKTLLTTTNYYAYVNGIVLSNNNVMVTYTDYNNSNYGTFIIYDQNGNVVKSATTFRTLPLYETKINKLNNDNILIVYGGGSASNDACFVIYDEDGNLVKSETTFNSGDTSYKNVSIFENGNFIISYLDGTNTCGKFIIYDEDGNVVKTATTFIAVTTQKISSTILSNGNVLIAYTDSNDSNYGKFVIYDEDGNVVKTATTFSSGNANFYEIIAITLPNDNIMIVYTNYSNSTYNGVFVIYDEDGNLVKAETTFNSGIASKKNVMFVDGGNVLIAYMDGGNSNYGAFVIYDENGNLIKDETIFNSGATSSGSTNNISTSLNNDNHLIIAYTDVDNSSYGTFNIIKIKNYDDGCMSLDNVTSNTINNVTCDKILQPSTKYELIYNSTSSKFELGGSKTLFDITLTEAVSQVDLTGIANMLEEDKIYSLSFIGGTSTSTNICFGDTAMIYSTNGIIFTPFFFESKLISGTNYIVGLKALSSGSSTNFGNSNLSDYEYVKCDSSGATFNVGTRIIIKEVA